MAWWDNPGQDFSGEATNPGYAGLSNAELGGLGVPGYENYAGPGEQPSLWDKLQDAIGQGGLPKTSMPGTTFGPQAGAAGAAPASIFPPGPTPPGMGAYFNAIQNPAKSGGNLAARYAALQQLMRGR
jgi:hypothetical protein